MKYSTAISNTIEKIVEEIDKSTMLGASWDCLSDVAKDRFKKKLSVIIDEVLNAPIPETV